MIDRGTLYIYNLKTGETVGIKKDKDVEGAEKNGQTVNFQDGSCNLEFDLIGNNTVEGIEFGSVGDLSFEQIVDLFLHGKLTSDELNRGLNVKGACDYSCSYSTQGNYNITFTYENKKYTLNCAYDAAKSQVDNKTVDNIDRNISIEDIQNTEEYYIICDDLWHEAQFFAYNYFGYKPPYDSGNPLTEEQLDFVFNNPQIFHLVKEPYGDGKYGIGTDDYIKEYAQYELTTKNGKMPETNYSYKEGEYDMFGNGNPPGPEGSIPTGVPGIFVKQNHKNNGENVATFYMWDAKIQEYVPTGERSVEHNNAYALANIYVENGKLVSYRVTNNIIRGGSVDTGAPTLFYSLIHGYNPTSIDGVYEKDGKYYRCNGGNADSWYEVSVDDVKVYSNPCNIGDTNTKNTNERAIGEAPEGAVATNIPGIYYKYNTGNSTTIYMWDDSYQRYSYSIVPNGFSIETLEKALKTGDLSLINTESYVKRNGYFRFIGSSAVNNPDRVYAANFFGMNSTSQQGIYEKDGKYYKYDVAHGDMHTTPMAGRFSEFFEEVSAPEVLKSSDITVYDTKPQVLSTKIDGISTISAPDNITYDEFMEVVTMINFLNTKVKDSQNLQFDTYNYFGYYNEDNELCSKLSWLQGVELTSENYQKYVNAITYYDRNELAAKVLEKLEACSFKIYAYENKQAIQYLLSGMGGTNISIIDGAGTAGKSFGTFTRIPTYATFTLNGKNYSLSFIPDEGAPINKDCIATKEEVEEMRKYMSPDSFNIFVQNYFVPLQSENGIPQSYMLNFDIQAKASSEYHLPAIFDYYKTHSADAYFAFLSPNANPDEYHVSIDKIQELKRMGLNDEVLNWYFDIKQNGTSISFNMDLDAGYPALYTYSALLNYAKTHDLNAEFAAAKAKSQSNQTANAPVIDEPEDFALNETAEAELEVIMTAEEYKKEAESKVAELQKKVGTVIKKDPVYYSQYNEKRYNYIYDPFEHKWITYEPNQISNGRAKDSSNVTLVRIEMIIAAINQGLSFTANPMVCRDEDGNYYDYNKESGTFIKRV